MLEDEHTLDNARPSRLRSPKLRHHPRRRRFLFLWGKCDCSLSELCWICKGKCGKQILTHRSPLPNEDCYRRWDKRIASFLDDLLRKAALDKLLIDRTSNSMSVVGEADNFTMKMKLWDETSYGIRKYFINHSDNWMWGMLKEGHLDAPKFFLKNF